MSDEATALWLIGRFNAVEVNQNTGELIVYISIEDLLATIFEALNLSLIHI